ncbi:MAG: hypothetical protein Q3959_01810 [Limosilactobacillus sp.]|uniref:hypothetical protein n=1 Tax=Limosilactobacillus sp. TaxID=2773925 RepID=UPI002705709C|nr:hypothetical protein [Limosilactobacillus sp.]
MNKIDVTKLLHSVIDLELSIDDAQELMIGPDARRQGIFARLDVELAEFAKTAGWMDVLHHNRELDKEQLLKVYVRVLSLFLLFSAKKQWTHLVVLSDEQWERITGSEKKGQLADLNREYLAIKNFLNTAYTNRLQANFSHAWHMILKMGLIDFGFDTQSIEEAYIEMIDQANDQYAN